MEGGYVMAFCSECGNQLNDKAVVCTQCGVAIEDRPNLNNQRSKWLLSMPIVGTVLGAFGFLATLSDIDYSEANWDTELVLLCVFLFAVPAIILGAVSVYKNIYKEVAIISSVLGSVSFISYVVISQSL